VNHAVRRICLIFWLCILVSGGVLAVESRRTYHDIDVKFDPETRMLNVTERISVSERSVIAFRLAGWLTIVSAEAEGETLHPRRTSGIWKIARRQRKISQLTLVLAGRVPALPPNDRHRRAAGAVAAAEGSYLPGYAAWVADTGDDQVNFRLRVEVPITQRAVATGRLIEEGRGNNTYRAHFEADYPSELPSLFVGPYTIQEKMFGKIRLRTYFHADIASLAETYLTTSTDYLEHYAKRIGDYPFDDFHIISAPLPVGLGFPNLTYIGRMIAPLPFMRGQSLAHEILHNWWGNGVVADYAHGNWAEGMTTYMADYGLAEQRGPIAAREMRLGWLRDYAALPAALDKPVVTFVSRTHQASQVIGYNKVALIFHMLRGELGEAIFAQGVKRFWADNKFKVAGWGDVQAAFEKVSGRHLRWFFKQWITRSGAPNIYLASPPIRKDGTISLTLHQGDPPYRLSVNVDVETTKGRARHQVHLQENSKTVKLPVNGKLLKVSVDAGFDVFRHLLPGESPPILRDVTLASTVTTSILSSESNYRAAAAMLIKRMLPDSKIYSTGLPINHADPVTGPTLVIGSVEEIAVFLATIDQSNMPDVVKSGTASAWVIRTTSGHPVLLVRADSVQAVKDIVRPLPHYGRQSYISFDGGHAARKGIWPNDSSPLSFHFN